MSLLGWEGATNAELLYDRLQPATAKPRPAGNFGPPRWSSEGGGSLTDLPPNVRPGKCGASGFYRELPGPDAQSTGKSKKIPMSSVGFGAD